MKEHFRELTKGMWTVPNAFTFSRILLVPVFAALYLKGEPYWALAVFALASVTDCFDGLLARKLNQISSLGKLLDPLADKILVLTAIACHAVLGVFPWPALIIMAAKELLMIAGGTVMLGKGNVVSANYFGKTATVFLMAAVIAGFFAEPLNGFGFPAHLWLLWIALGLSLLAFGVYAYDAFKSLTGKRGDTAAD